MNSAYQRPFATTSFNSPSHKSVKAANILDLTKYRLDRFTSNLIQSTATIGQKFSFHQLRRRQAIRYRLFRRRLLGHRFSLFIIFLHCYQYSTSPTGVFVKFSSLQYPASAKATPVFSFIPTACRFASVCSSIGCNCCLSFSSCVTSSATIMPGFGRKAGNCKPCHNPLSMFSNPLRPL